MKNLLPFLLMLLSLLSCKQSAGEMEEAAPVVAESSKVEKTPISDLSIYNLPSGWTTQENEEIELVDLRGKVLVLVMIYTQCKAACPRLVADMRNLEGKFSERELDNLQFIFVSIDPEVDTPDRMKEFLKQNAMEDEHWLFLRGSKEDTQEFAAVLAVNYTRISPIDFSHSNIISVFDKNGILLHQKEGLGVDNVETITAIQKEVSK